MYIVKGLRVIVLFQLMPLIRGSRGGTGGSNPHPPPLVNHKDKAILVRMPWKIIKIPRQHSLKGHHWPASETPFELVDKISNTVVCATNKGSDQPAHTHSLIRAFARRLNML